MHRASDLYSVEMSLKRGGVTHVSVALLHDELAELHSFMQLNGISDASTAYKAAVASAIQSKGGQYAVARAELRLVQAEIRAFVMGKINVSLAELISEFKATELDAALIEVQSALQDLSLAKAGLLTEEPR